MSLAQRDRVAWRDKDVSNLGYTGRNANGGATAAHDPQETLRLAVGRAKALKRR
jgi:hypothetical protein